MGFLDNLRKEIAELSQTVDKQLADMDARMQTEQKHTTEELEKLENYIKERAAEINKTTKGKYDEAEKYALDRIADAKKAVNTDWAAEAQTAVKKQLDEAYKATNAKLDELKNEASKKTGVSEETIKNKIAEVQKAFNQTALDAITRIEDNIAKAKKNLTPPQAASKPEEKK